jgi:hypothetical protein
LLLAHYQSVLPLTVHAQAAMEQTVPAVLVAFCIKVKY